jgi:hypothetical protein
VRRICFVTCRTWPEISESDRLVQRALEARGASVEARAWNAPGAGWDGFLDPSAQWQQKASRRLANLFTASIE